jgi:O-antigen/teichoic acid export membrane protein
MSAADLGRTSSTGPTVAPALVRSTLLNFTDTAISAVSAVAVSIVLARALGPVTLGLYSLVTSTVTFVLIFARLGVSDTVTRYVAELSGQGELSIASMVTARAVAVVIVAGVVATILLALGSGLLAGLYRHRELQRYFLIGSVSLAPQLVSGVLRGVMRGLQKWQRLVLLNLLTSPVWVIGSIAVVIGGAGITGLLVVGTAVELVLVVLLAWWAVAALGVRVPAPIPRPLRARLVRYNVALALLTVINLVVWNRSELFFLGRLSSPEQVAYYTVPFSLTGRACDLIPGALLGVLVPGLSHAHGLTGETRFLEVLNQALRYLAVVTLPICLFGLAASPLIIRILYGATFDPAVPVLQVLFVTAILAVLSQAMSSALLGAEAPGYLLKVGLGVVVLSVALDLLLIPRWGAVGAAAAKTVVQAAWAVAALLPLRRLVLAGTWLAIAKAAAVAAPLAALGVLASAYLTVQPGVALAGWTAAAVVYGAAVYRLQLVPEVGPLSRLRPAFFLVRR